MNSKLDARSELTPEVDEGVLDEITAGSKGPNIDAVYTP